MRFKNFKEIIRNTTMGYGKIFALFTQALIILSLITFSIETLPNLSEIFKRNLNIIEFIIVIIFTIEYIIRVITAPNKKEFIFSFYGIVDLLAILPFYLRIGLDLRAIRIFRLLRLLRIFKLMRYNRAINNFYFAFKKIKEELILFSFITAMVLYVSAVGIYYFEKDVQPEHFKSIFHSLWWAVATLTTVGYGDVYPVTIGGRVFTFVMLMVGLGVVAVPTGLLSSALTEVRDDENKIEEKEEIKKIKEVILKLYIKGLTKEEISNILNINIEKIKSIIGEI